MSARAFEVQRRFPAAIYLSWSPTSIKSLGGSLQLISIPCFFASERSILTARSMAPAGEKCSRLSVYLPASSFDRSNTSSGQVKSGSRLTRNDLLVLRAGGNGFDRLRVNVQLIEVALLVRDVVRILSPPFHTAWISLNSAEFPNLALKRSTLL